ncbi:MAG TPA: right-handed parallel beta-helix repeat-containing protein [Candidatus Kryptonia bacterium]
MKINIAFAALLSLSAAAYGQIYVSPSGSDSNAGTIGAPLQTISKAMSMATAGTTIYLREGVYNISSTLGTGVSGTAGNYINLWAYPGETPILDFAGESYSSSSRGIELKRNYWYLKGLVIRNAGDNGIYISGFYNIVENCQISNCKDSGIQISNGGSYNYIHNCDSFGNNDPATQGQNADGIDAKLVAGPGNVIRGCRVYDNADDGYDCYGTGFPVIFDSCWAFHNGYNLWGISGFTGNGNGFKLGGADSIGLHVVTNCVSFDNVVKGFDQNNNMGGVTLYNCTSYRNGTYNFSFPSVPLVAEDTLKNDLSYAGGWNSSAGSGGDARLNADAVIDSNSWTNHSVMASDFLSLDTSLARVTRLPDGSLPSTPLFRLAPSSSLIDAGIDVGLRFAGSAPDLGAFESGIGSTYSETNGTGGGDWNSGSTWKSGAIPVDTSDVVISGGDSVIVTSSPPATCRSLILQSNSKLNVEAPLSVSGSISVQSGAWYYNSLPTQPSFVQAGEYYISPSSFYVHTSGAGNLLGSPGYDSTFGNVIVSRGGTVAGTNLTINGNLIIQTGGPAAIFSGCATVSLAHTIHGSVFVNSGEWSAVDTNGTANVVGVWNVDGNVFVGSALSPNSARLGPFSGTTAAGSRTGIINIGGNLSMANGATLQAGGSTGSTSTSETGILNLKGNFTTDNTVSYATNSIGAFAFNFTGAGGQSVILGKPFAMSSLTMQPVVFDTVAASSSLTFVTDSTSWSGGAGGGKFVVNGGLTLAPSDTLKGSQSFSLDDGATFSITYHDGVASNGVVQVTGARSYSKNANYVYSGSLPQITGDNLPDSVNNLTIINSSGVSLTNSVVVKGRIAFVNGQLLLGRKNVVAASVVGGSATTYAMTDTSGGQMTIASVGSAQTLFPVGTHEAYSPVWITNGNGPDAFSVSVIPDSSLPEYAGGDGGRVNVKWDITEQSAGTSDCAIKLGWMSAEENTPFAANRDNDSRIFLLSQPDSDAGSGNYTFQLSSQPYTISRGNITALGWFGVGKFGRTTGVNESPNVPLAFQLYQNFPNPFNPSTEIDFTVAKRGLTALKVYNILGQRVATLFMGTADPGRKYVVRFNSSGLSSGLYLSVLENGSQRQIRKMILMK